MAQAQHDAICETDHKDLETICVHRVLGTTAQQSVPRNDRKLDQAVVGEEGKQSCNDSWAIYDKHAMIQHMSDKRQVLEDLSR